MERLTDDLIVLLFSQFKPIEIASEIELVCKRWHKLARCSPCLWNDGVLLSKSGTLEPLNRKVLGVLLQRSKEHLGSLAVRINDNCSRTDCDWIIRRLPRLGTKELCIQIGPSSELCHHDGRSIWDMVFNSSRRYESAHFEDVVIHNARRYWEVRKSHSKSMSGRDVLNRWPKLLAGIANCSELQSLQIETSHMPIVAQDFKGLRFFPRLRRLAIHSLYAKNLLMGLAQINALREVTHLVQAEYPSGSQHAILETDLVDIIQPCQDTLQWLEVSVRWSPSLHLDGQAPNTPATVITLPLLGLLILRSPCPFPARPPIEVSRIMPKVRLECPKLTKLAVDLPVPVDILQDLFTPRLQYLHLYIQGLCELEDDNSAIGNALSHCSSLQTLVLQCDGVSTTVALIEQLLVLTHVPIVSLSIISDKQVQPSLLEKLVLSRQDNPLVQPIERLRLEGCAKVDKAASQYDDDDAESRCCARLYACSGFAVSQSCCSKIELVQSSRCFLGSKRRRLF